MNHQSPPKLLHDYDANTVSKKKILFPPNQDPLLQNFLLLLCNVKIMICSLSIVKDLMKDYIYLKNLFSQKLSLFI